jgi:hypothetical protein
LFGDQQKRSGAITEIKKTPVEETSLAENQATK